MQELFETSSIDSISPLLLFCVCVEINIHRPERFAAPNNGTPDPQFRCSRWWRSEGGVLRDLICVLELSLVNEYTGVVSTLSGA